MMICNVKANRGGRDRLHQLIFTSPGTFKLEHDWNISDESSMSLVKAERQDESSIKRLTISWIEELGL